MKSKITLRKPDQNNLLKPKGKTIQVAVQKRQAKTIGVESHPAPAPTTSKKNAVSSTTYESKSVLPTNPNDNNRDVKFLGANSNNKTENTYNYDDTLAALFDPVTVMALEKMFPAKEKWKEWAERAARNKLKAARTGRAAFNPYLASIFFLNQGISGWDRARCNRVLANNLPARSRNDRHMLTDDDRD